MYLFLFMFKVDKNQYFRVGIPHCHSLLIDPTLFLQHNKFIPLF